VYAKNFKFILKIYSLTAKCVTSTLMGATQTNSLSTINEQLKNEFNFYRQQTAL